jgi:hydroxymethylglutaryl-CoA lyase
MKIIVSPRDSMQGLKQYIPAEVKADYINSLLKVGFDTVDFGSFVSLKAIPQLRDTSEVLKKIDLSLTKSKLLAVVCNLKGAKAGSEYSEINSFGFPFSTSPTFLKRNINSTTEEAYNTIEEIQKICIKKNKDLVVYFSMAFGNPYGDEHNDYLIFEAIERLKKLQIKTICLSDILGVGDNEIIARLFSNLHTEFPDIEFGLHLHLKQNEALNRIDSAFKAGCRYFDTALLGLGGCPMSGEEMVGNLSTEKLVEYLELNKIEIPLNTTLLNDAVVKAREIFHFKN